MEQRLVSVVCRSCGNRETTTWTEVIQFLRGLGRLRRDSAPSWGAVQQLWQIEAADQVCASCQASGSEIQPWLAEDDWGDTARKCERCGKAISEDRLSVFPDAIRCAPCQSLGDGPAGGDTGSFCPRCGDHMVIALAGGGRGAYVERCKGCGYRS